MTAGAEEAPRYVPTALVAARRARDRCAADARALATSMALVARDREARRLIHEAAHGELAADWRRSMDLTELKKGVTKNGSLIQGH